MNVIRLEDRLKKSLHTQTQPCTNELYYSNLKKEYTKAWIKLLTERAEDNVE